MLNPFPELLSLSFFAPLILRAVVGLLFVRIGTRYLTDDTSIEDTLNDIGLRPGRVLGRVLGFVQLAGGIMLVLGFLTQIAALVLAFVTVGGFALKQSRPDSLPYSRSFYLLITAVLLALLILGAGAFAIDIPL